MSQSPSRRHGLKLIGGCALGAVAGPHIVRAQTYKSEYKLSVVAGRPTSFGVIGDEWAANIRERTGGRINIQVYPNSMLVGGDQTREFSALRQGVIDMAIGPGISWSSQVREFNVFSLPFLIPTNEVADAIVAGPTGTMILDRLRQLGVEPLAWGDCAFRIVCNSRHPIRRPNDLRGLKDSRDRLTALHGVVYEPRSKPDADRLLTEMQTALASGAVDGADQSVEGYHLLRLITLRQRHLTLLNYCWEPAVLSVNRSVWNDWSPADREVVRDTAVEFARRMREMKRRGLTATDRSLVQEMEGTGAAVIELTSEEREAFREATRNVYTRWAAMLNRDLVAAAERSAAEAQRR